MMNTKCNHSKGDLNVEAKSSSPCSCGKFIEVVIMLILIYCLCMVNAALTVETASMFLILLLLSAASIEEQYAALHGWYYMVFVATVGEEYDKVFNHLDMLHAPLEKKVLILTTAKSLLLLLV
ncbi:hypothetical protein Tco_0551524 [Tanacetum coccineum]